MKILIDMNLSPRLVAFFAEAGFAALHWSSVGLADASDVQIMAYAKANDFVVLTHDLDFGAILAATNAEKPSVVQIRSDDLTPETLAGPIIAGLRQFEQVLAAGALVTIDPARLRVRALPLDLN
jgi:predicted nuclease of predicted toxin-antitoxin system